MLAVPDLEEIWYWRGLVEAAKGEKDAALKDFDRAIRFNPGFSNAAQAKAQVESGALPRFVSSDRRARLCLASLVER